MARSWYAFVNGNPQDVSNYFKLNAKFSCLCGNNICVIYAAGNERQPKAPLSYNMQRYIRNALDTGVIQPEYPYDAKKYVYLRDY